MIRSVLESIGDLFFLFFQIPFNWFVKSLFDPLQILQEFFYKRNEEKIREVILVIFASWWLVHK